MAEARIVVIGGGTGLSVILKGLKKITSRITAIVTVADDGGGSGVLREDLGMLPPGDIRACLIALSDVEPILEELFNYRYENGHLKGQSFGNLMIAAMTGISKDFRDAVIKVGEIIAINGRVLPVTTQNIHLEATLMNGKVILGESKIPLSVLKDQTAIDRVVLVPPEPSPTEGVVEAIYEADLVIVGPGSIYTSILPNLLVRGVADALRGTSAKVAYIANLMTQPGETDEEHLKGYLQVMERHVGGGLFDLVFANSEHLDRETREIYKRQNAFPVKTTRGDRQFLEEKGIRLVKNNYIDVVKHYCRHDFDRLVEDLQKELQP